MNGCLPEICSGVIRVGVTLPTGPQKLFPKVVQLQAEILETICNLLFIPAHSQRHRSDAESMNSAPYGVHRSTCSKRSAALKVVSSHESLEAFWPRLRSLILARKEAQGGGYLGIMKLKLSPTFGDRPWLQLKVPVNPCWRHVFQLLLTTNNSEPREKTWANVR